MGDTSESSARGQGSNGSAGGKKADDEEDIDSGRRKHARRRRRVDDLKSSAHLPRSVRKVALEERSGKMLSHRHLHARQNLKERLDTPSVADTARAPGATPSLAIHPGSSRAPDQVFLSTTPPPSPVETPPESPFPTTTFSNSSSPRPTTVTTYVQTSIFTPDNRTATSTEFHFRTETVGPTVVVYAYPSALLNGTSTSRSTSSRTSSSTTARTTSASSSASPTVSPTVIIGGGAGVNPTPTTPVARDSPTITATTTGGGTVANPKIIGGVLGGLAGLALILWAILFLIKRHKRNALLRAQDEAGYGGPLEPPMRDRSSTTPLAAAVGFFRQQSRQSQISEPVSEPSFVKVSGRKLPPVLGGPRPDIPPNTSSFYQDEHGQWIGGPSSSAAGLSRHSQFSAATASPMSTSHGGAFTPAPPTPISPPGTAITTSTGAGAMVPPSRIREEREAEDSEGIERLATPRTSRPHAGGSVPRDALGRSLPSHDGSRASRFTEDIV